MPRSDPTPVWVLQKTRELVARATPAHIIAGIITAAGYPATERQVRRWKVKHGIKSQWAGDDGQLDQIMQQLRDDDELGEQEGYRWVHSVINEAVPGDEPLQTPSMPLVQWDLPCRIVSAPPRKTFLFYPNGCATLIK
jgi:hypothetical protein